MELTVTWQCPACGARFFAPAQLDLSFSCSQCLSILVMQAVVYDCGDFQVKVMSSWS